MIGIGLINDDLFKNLTPDDVLICHFITLPVRPNVRKVILSCHEKNLYKVGQVNKYWDEVVFINQKHRLYHKDYFGKFQIIPNLREKLEYKEKPELDKIAGIIGTFDENKQTHVSIKRALNDECEIVYLFGEPSYPFYTNFIEPLLSDKVIVKGFIEDKQSMYDMIGRVYHSSISEVATLVKDECYSTGTKFFGNDATDTPISTLDNSEIIDKWIKLLK
jgi:hypothetical protein